MALFGYDTRLVEPDGKPSCELQRVLHAIGRFVAFGANPSPIGRPCITPDMMHKWYSYLGAYAEILNFWTRSDKHICYVYTLLRIPHSLEQKDKEYDLKPSVPCLDLYGFERWMMSRLCFDPEETAQFIMQCAFRGLFLGLDSPTEDMLKRGIPRVCFPYTPKPTIVNQYHEAGFYNWADMANRALARKHFHQRKKQRAEKEKEKGLAGQVSQPTIDLAARNLHPAVEISFGSDVETVSTSTTQSSRHPFEKTSFNYRTELPVLNLSTNNECGANANSTRWISDSDDDSDTGSDFGSQRGRSRCSSPPPRGNDIAAVEPDRIPQRAFALLTVERSTPFSTPSPSRSPILRAVDRSGHGDEHNCCVDANRYSVKVDATRLSERRCNGTKVANLKVSENTRPSHNGYGNVDSDSDSRRSSVCSN